MSKRKAATQDPSRANSFAPCDVANMSKKRRNAATADSMKSIFSQMVPPPQDPPIGDAGVDVEDDGTREGKYIDPGDEGVKGQVMGEQKDTVSHEAAHTSTCMIQSQGAKETTTGTKKGITN